MMLGKHCLKSWSSTQDVVATSSGEAEYYAMVRGGSQGIGMRGIMEDLGIKVGIEIKTDARAAKGIASRRGVGKIRHIEVSQLWLQEKVSSGEVVVTKVPGQTNLADILTKYVGREDLDRHRITSGFEEVAGRHKLMPQVND